MSLGISACGSSSSKGSSNSSGSSQSDSGSISEPGDSSSNAESEDNQSENNNENPNASDSMTSDNSGASEADNSSEASSQSNSEASSSSQSENTSDSDSNSSGGSSVSPVYAWSDEDIGLMDEYIHGIYLPHPNFEASLTYYYYNESLYFQTATADYDSDDLNAYASLFGSEWRELYTEDGKAFYTIKNTSDGNRYAFVEFSIIDDDFYPVEEGEKGYFVLMAYDPFVYAWPEDDVDDILYYLLIFLLYEYKFFLHEKQNLYLIVLRLRQNHPFHDL